jgi:hypothetical protein
MNKSLATLLSLSSCVAFDVCAEATDPVECNKGLVGKLVKAVNPPSDSRSLYMDLWSYEQTSSKNVVAMNIYSQYETNNGAFKMVVSTSSSEFALMTTDCPRSMCNIANLYDYVLAPDEQSNIRVKEVIYKFDDQPMSSF